MTRSHPQPSATPWSRFRQARIGCATLALLAALSSAHAQVSSTGPQVVGDGACPYYADDIAAFATCEGSRVVTASAAQTRAVTTADSAQRLAVVTQRVDAATVGEVPVDRASRQSISPKRSALRRRP